MITCRVCGKENPEHIFHCEEHYHCADCGTRKDLCTYSEDVLCFPCHDKRVEKRISDFDGDTTLTDEIVCPWCGYEQSDSWEYPDSDDKCMCGDCERTFEMYREIEVSYTTSRN